MTACHAVDFPAVSARVVHRQGVEPWCADLSGPATYPRHGAFVLVRRSGVEPVCQRYKPRILTGGRRMVRALGFQPRLFAGFKSAASGSWARRAWYSASGSNRASMLCKSMPSTSRGALRSAEFRLVAQRRPNAHFCVEPWLPEQDSNPCFKASKACALPLHHPAIIAAAVRPAARRITSSCYDSRSECASTGGKALPCLRAWSLRCKTCTCEPPFRSSRR
jgi:hypothetical protein